MKLSKKNLKELAISLDAYYCGGNVYNHENITEYVSNPKYNITKLNEYSKKDNDVYTLMERVAKNRAVGKTFTCARLIAYSCGNYGNSGQLVKYDVSDINGVIDTFYTYYC